MTSMKNELNLMKLKELKEIRTKIKRDVYNNVLTNTKEINVKIDEVTQILRRLKTERGDITNKNKYRMKDLGVPIGKIKK